MLQLEILAPKLVLQRQEGSEANRYNNLSQAKIQNSDFQAGGRQGHDAACVNPQFDKMQGRGNAAAQ